MTFVWFLVIGLLTIFVLNEKHQGGSYEAVSELIHMPTTVPIEQIIIMRPRIEIAEISKRIINEAWALSIQPGVRGIVV